MVKCVCPIIERIDSNSKSGGSCPIFSSLGGITKKLGDGGDLLGDGVDLLGDGVDLLGDGGNLQ